MSKINTKERKCEICQNIFTVKYPSSKCRTCPNTECRKKIRSNATKRFYKNNPDAKKNLSDKIKQKWKDPDYKEKTLRGIEKRDYKKENHPSWGLKRTDKQKKNISDGILQNKENEDVDKMVELIKNNYESFKDKLFKQKEKICKCKHQNHYKKKKIKLEELKIKKGNCCIDCGCNDCLEFDHISGKINNILDMNFNRMEKEAEKCELRCILCHAIKSYNENYNTIQNKIRINNDKNINNRILRKRRRDYIAKIKKVIGGCQYCKYKNDDMPFLFDFDHMDSSKKNKGIAYHVGHGSSVKIIHEELEKCILLCKKCHYKRTAIQMDYNRIMK